MAREAMSVDQSVNTQSGDTVNLFDEAKFEKLNKGKDLQPQLNFDLIQKKLKKLPKENKMMALQ